MPHPERGRGGLCLQRRDTRARHALRLPRACCRRRFHITGAATDNVAGFAAGYRGHGRAHRLRQIGHRSLVVAPADLDSAGCTIEEREEYEPHIALGNVVFAGVDYSAILAAAESQADLIVWDGGNNDFSFIRPDLNIVVADALRPRQIASHHPGETTARMADVFVLNKADAAAPADVEIARAGLRAVNARAPIVLAASPVRLDDAEAVSGKRVLVIEDGPTITHGGMAYGAGYIAAKMADATAIIDPRESAVPEIVAIFRTYPHIGKVLPAVGYGAAQLQALAATVNSSAAEVVISATPIDLARAAPINKKIVRARYEYAEIGSPALSSLIDAFLLRLSRGLADSP